MPTSDTRYSTADWRHIRALVLHRDGYRCQMRLPGCTIDAPLRGGHANHKISPLDGGAFFDPDNIEAACASCNLSAGATYGNRRRRGAHYQPSRDW